jgi:hypothetical protein
MGHPKISLKLLSSMDFYICANTILFVCLFCFFFEILAVPDFGDLNLGFFFVQFCDVAQVAIVHKYI